MSDICESQRRQIKFGDAGLWQPCRPDSSIPPFCRAFWRPTADEGHLVVFVGQEPAQEPLWHLSMSHSRLTRDGRRVPGRYPRWEEIHEARVRFTPDEVCMAIILPPRELYLNEHPTTIHLWQVPMELAT